MNRPMENLAYKKPASGISELRNSESMFELFRNGTVSSVTSLCLVEKSTIPSGFQKSKYQTELWNLEIAWYLSISYLSRYNGVCNFF